LDRQEVIYGVVSFSSPTFRYIGTIKKIAPGNSADVTSQEASIGIPVSNKVALFVKY
jgi:hypothetical protein